MIATCVVEVSGPPAVDCVWQKWWSGVDADPRDDGQAHSSSAATIRDTRNVSRTRATCSRCILVARDGASVSSDHFYDAENLRRVCGQFRSDQGAGNVCLKRKSEAVM